MEAYQSNEDLNVNKAPNRQRIEYFSRLAELYDLDTCIWWIRNNKYESVCLQFPESLLIDSVDIAAYIKSNVPYKVFILPERLNENCCVDEMMARRMEGKAVIHFGHPCLTPVNIPVFYVLHKKPLDVKKFLDTLEDLNCPTPLIILYDVGYFHIMDDIRISISERQTLREKVCIPDLVLPYQTIHLTACSTWCSLRTTKAVDHSQSRLQRAYCVPLKGPFNSLVYLGEASANLYNFLTVFKEGKILKYTDKNGFSEVCRACVEREVNKLLKRIMKAKNIGIITPTMATRQHKYAIDYAANLCKESKKNVDIISLLRPDQHKLSHFSDVDVFVSVSCPESDFEYKKGNVQPIVGLYELELALNNNRQWPQGCSRNFMEVIDFRFSDHKMPLKEDVVSTSGFRVQLVSPMSSSISEMTKSGPSTISDGSGTSISTSSLVRVATAASMRTVTQKNGAPQVSPYYMGTYNINKLMNQQNANRAAQSLVHQMNTVNKDDMIRMKAYQVTDRKPVRDPFITSDISSRRKEEFWANHKKKYITTTVLDRRKSDGNDENRSLYPEYIEREYRIDKKLREIENLSNQIAALLETQERTLEDFPSDLKNETGEFHSTDKDVDGHSPEERRNEKTYTIPASILDQLTNPQTHNRDAKKGKSATDDQKKYN